MTAPAMTDLPDAILRTWDEDQLEELYLWLRSNALRHPNHFWVAVLPDGAQVVMCTKDATWPRREVLFKVCDVARAQELARGINISHWRPLRDPRKAIALHLVQCYHPGEVLPVTRCHDCGAEIPEERGFETQRCVPCAVKAGKQQVEQQLDLQRAG